MSRRLAATTCGLIALPLFLGAGVVTAEAAPKERPVSANSTKPGRSKPSPTPTSTTTTTSTPTATSTTSPTPTATTTTTATPTATSTTTATPTSTSTTTTSTPVATTTTTPAPSGSVFASRVVTGAANVTDGAGRTWERRTTGVGSWKSASTTVDITGTTDDALYSKSAPAVKWYRVHTPAAADYQVRLLMAETYFSSAGQRVFDVVAEGRTVATGVDIAKAVGKNAAYDLTFTVPVTDGRLDVEFVAKVDQPVFSAVEVTSTTPVPALAPVKPLVNIAPNSFFTTDISNAPLAPNSAQASAHLLAQVTNNWGGVAAFNAYRYNNSFYEVPADQPKKRVAFYDCQNKGYTPGGLFDGPAQFVDVPIPDNAIPATGTDKELTIYDRSADKLWDFWVTEKQADGTFRACWGGRIDNLSQNQGIMPNPFGATATGVAMTPGVISIEEFRRGKIDHAMYLAIMDPARWDTFSWPATRADGSSTDPNAIMEGQRLRLDPTLDLSTIPMTPVARMVAEAAQKYGFVVADKAGAVAVVTESGNKEKAATGVDPWDGMLAGPDYQAMQGFPWDKIQVLPKDYGKPAN